MSDVSERSRQYVVAYNGVRGRVTELVASVDQTALDCASPATPEWRARDVLAHLVGVADDAISGRIDGIASDEWTAAQVNRRLDVTPADMLEEWDRVGPPFEDALAVIPEVMAGQALFDAFTHEHDLRRALDRPGARDSDALELVYEWVVDVRSLGDAPALRLNTEAGTVVAGNGEPVATIGATRFEMVRASTGRRCASELEQWDWDPAPQPSLMIVAPFFRMRDEPLNE
jgi:uncharacterized protein (TIGR03083 family)